MLMVRHINVKIEIGVKNIGLSWLYTTRFDHVRSRLNIEN